MQLFLQIKTGRIPDILWAFLLKQWLSTVSSPTRTRGIIVKYGIFNPYGYYKLQDTLI